MITIEEFREKVKINYCDYQELLRLPGIGGAIADQLWSYRMRGVFIDERTLASVPYLRTFRQLLDIVDFSPIQTQHQDFLTDEDSEAESSYGELDKTVYEKKTPIKGNINSLSKDTQGYRNEVKTEVFHSPKTPKIPKSDPNISTANYTQLPWDTPRSYCPISSPNLNKHGMTYTVAGAPVTPPFTASEFIYADSIFNTKRL